MVYTPQGMHVTTLTSRGGHFLKMRFRLQEVLQVTGHTFYLEKIIYCTQFIVNAVEISYEALLCFAGSTQWLLVPNTCSQVTRKSQLFFTEIIRRTGSLQFSLPNSLRYHKNTTQKGQNSFLSVPIRTLSNIK